MNNVIFNIKNGLPTIGYGTFPNKDILVDVIPIAIESGYEIIDTSDNYNNEEYVGKALKNCQHVPIIISKFSQPMRTDELEQCFLESKEKLGGCLDVYLLHWPYPYLWKEQWRRMEELVISGKCKAIGVCNFELKELKELLKLCRIKPIVNQIERHPGFQQREITEFCNKNGIKVMCYSPLARNNSYLFNNKILESIAIKYNKTIGQIILRWDLQTDSLPIPASKSVDHVKDNINIYDFSLSSRDIEMINEMEIGNRVRFDPKTRFSNIERFKFLVARILIMLGVKIAYFRRK